MAKKDEKEQDIMDKATEMRDAAQERMKQARKKLSEMNDTMVDYITENPVKSVLIAAGIGLIVGKMMARRE